MGGVCNPIVARGSAFVYPPAITRQRAGSADLGGMNPAASRAKYKVKLTVIHEIDKPDSKLIGMVSNGWPLILASLKSLLETGESLSETRRWPQGK
jgi:hypothetical protein